MISIIALAVSIITALLSFVSFFWSTYTERKKATLDAFVILQKECFDKLNLIKPSDIRDISNETTSDLYNEISGYVARIEHFCVGVNNKIYDPNTVYQLAHGYLDGNKIISRIEPIIQQKNKNSDTDYYSNIHTVLKWMKRKSKKEIRKRNVK